MSLLGHASPLKDMELISSLLVSRRQLDTLPCTILWEALTIFKKCIKQHLYVSGHLVLFFIKLKILDFKIVELTNYLNYWITDPTGHTPQNHVIVYNDCCYQYVHVKYFAAHMRKFKAIETQPQNIHSACLGPRLNCSLRRERERERKRE